MTIWISSNATQPFNIFNVLPYLLHFWLTLNYERYEIRSGIFNLASKMFVQICQILQMIDPCFALAPRQQCVLDWPLNKKITWKQFIPIIYLQRTTRATLCVIVYPWNDQMTSCAQTFKLFFSLGIKHSEDFKKIYCFSPTLYFKLLCCKKNFPKAQLKKYITKLLPAHRPDPRSRWTFKLFFFLGINHSEDF